MRYLLLIYAEERASDMSPEDLQAERDAYGKFTADILKSGAMESGEALQPTETATTVRVRGGETLTTDGPFAETKEALGGFYLVKADDLNEAIEIAARIPGAKHGSIEVRPIMELPEDYTQSVAEQAGVSGS